MQEINLQEQFFETIFQRSGRRSDMIDEICECLNLSKDAVYRRIRGATVLSPDEMAVLARRYQVSVDTLINGHTDNVLCQFNVFSRQPTDPAQYINGFIADFEQIFRLPNPHLYYASVEIPVFTYNFFPELLAFKLYIWGRTTWNFPYLRDRLFDFELVTPPLARMGETMLRQYLSMNSTELWSVQIMDNTLAQIEYHTYSGGFRNSPDALTLCDKLTAWVNHARNMAKAGRKFGPGEPTDRGGLLNLYHNEMVYTNITALLTSDSGHLVYSAYCNPNFLKSTDPNLCEYTENWFNNIIAKSTPIAKDAEKNRDWFFRELQKRVDRVRLRIQSYLEDAA